MFNSIKEKVASIELKAPFFDLKKSNDNGLETVDYNDISKEIDKIKEENNEAKTDEVNEDVKVAKVKGWNVYTIQVASVEDKDEISKIEEVLSKEKVPFSTINIEGVTMFVIIAALDFTVKKIKKQNLSPILLIVISAVLGIAINIV